MKCAIQWVDRNGIPTPDDNDATLVVQIKAHYSEELERCGAVDCNVKASAWLPCCDNHAKRMNEPGMRYWVSKPIPCDYGEETL